MTVALVMTTSGRWDYLRQTLTSAFTQLDYPFAHLRIVDDSGGSQNVQWPPGWEIIQHPSRLGLAAAVQSAWSNLPPEIDLVFHLEDDWVFRERIDIDAMAMALTANPQLAQIVLKRQPGNPEEARAGGIIECHPDDYVDHEGFVEHRRIFSLNPCLIPRHIIDRGWPSHGSEGDFTRGLVEQGYSFAFWGKRFDQPKIWHIGDQRSAGWLL